MRTVYFSGLLLLSFLAGLAQAQSAVVTTHGQLKVQGNRILDKNNNPVAFNGMAIYWSQWMPAFYNAQCVKWLVDDWKCTVVRPSIAVTSKGYDTNPAEEMRKAKVVIQAAIDNGVYVIVDWHETGNANERISLAKEFFTEIAKTYGQLPNIIYETWNEPTNEHPWATVIKPYHEEIIKTIRAIDPDNLILCGTRSWAQEVDEASKNPITSSTNIVYTLHYYAATHKQFLRDKAITALKNGIALMVTEGGLSENTGGGMIDTAEARRWLDFMQANGIWWTNWSLSNITESSSALKVGSPATGNWSADQLSPSGTWVRNALRGIKPTTSSVGQRITGFRGKSSGLSFSTASQASPGGYVTSGLWPSLLKVDAKDLLGRNRLMTLQRPD